MISKYFHHIIHHITEGGLPFVVSKCVHLYLFTVLQHTSLIDLPIFKHFTKGATLIVNCHQHSFCRISNKPISVQNHQWNKLSMYWSLKVASTLQSKKVGILIWHLFGELPSMPLIKSRSINLFSIWIMSPKTLIVTNRGISYSWQIPQVPIPYVLVC